MYINYFRLCKISGGTSRQPIYFLRQSVFNSIQIRHVFCLGAYSRAQPPDILNRAHWLTPVAPIQKIWLLSLEYLVSARSRTWKLVKPEVEIFSDAKPLSSRFQIVLILQ